MKKSNVNGDNVNPVFKWLKNERAGLLGMTRIKVCGVVARTVLLPLTCGVTVEL